MNYFLQAINIGRPSRFTKSAPRERSNGIMGVHSLSDKTPIKITNFSYADRAFEGITKYSDWKFIYTSPMTSQIPAAK